MLDTFFEKFWLPSLAVLSDMEGRGVLLDTEYLARKHVLASEELATLETQLAIWAADFTRQKDNPLNWNSHVQVKEFLFDFKGFPIPPVKGPLNATKRNSKKERVSCESGVDWLSKNTTETRQLRLLLQYKKTTKLAQFLEKLPTQASPDGRLRYSIGPNTDTGRCSCKNPNLQQIPVRADKFRIRHGFIARPGYVLIVSDFSQLEMYVMAHFLIHHYSDYSLAEALAAGDAHTAMAFRIWGDQLEGATPETIKERPEWAVHRANAKTLNYAVPYGKTAAGLGSQILDSAGRPIGKKRAQVILDDFFAANPGLERLFEQWRNQARDTGEVHTLLGRSRPLPDATASDKWMRWAAERKAVNTPVQGSAADIVTAAMMATVGAGPTQSTKPLARELGDLGAELLLQVHDELIFEIPLEHAERGCYLVKEIMENPFDRPLGIQLKCDAQVGQSWGECK